ncbi:GapR family DNA-binding domain-containing protein [Microvirga pakistanensis]
MSGLDVKILREIIKFRKQDQDGRSKHDSLLDVYMRAMDEAGAARVAEAA